MHPKLFLPSLLLLGFTACAPRAGAATPQVTASATLPPSEAFATPAGGCSVIQAIPTPNLLTALPAIDASDYVRGRENAPVTMLVYCDFQSAQCQAFAGVMDELLKNHPADLQVVFRPLPALGVLDKSLLSVEAALAAGEQGKFWELRDLLHSRYSEWVDLSPPQFEAWIQAQAGGLGLEAEKFRAGLKSPETEARARSRYDAARQSGVNAIPLVFINGNLQQAYVLDYASLEATIALVALGARQFKACPPFEIDPSRQYIARLRTEKGEIVIQLFADKAPLAVNSFVFLARQGWFNGVTFHRVIPGFIAQAGDPSGTGRGGPGYFFKNEISDLKFDQPGRVGMANAGPDTNGSQFFITYAPQPHLDGMFTIFGQVLRGMDVLESLTRRDPSQPGFLPPGDRILEVNIEER